MVKTKCIQSFTVDNLSFQSGIDYVMSESIETQIRAKSSAVFGMSIKINSTYKGENLDNKSILITRTKGIGDILMLLNAIQELKKKYPTCKISVATQEKDILNHEMVVDKLYSMPFDSELIKKHDYWISFQGIMESNDLESRTEHPSDLFLKRLFLQSDKKIAELHFSALEMNWYEEMQQELKIHSDDLEREADFVIGIQIMPSNLARAFPTDKMKCIIDILSKENIDICLIGNNDSTNLTLAEYYKSGRENIKICCNFSIRQTICFSQRYDLIIAPDSMMIQVAGCLNKPCVGIYGPFPSDLRMRYHNNSIGIDSCVVCSPCFIYQETCFKGQGFSPCWNNIYPAHILEAVDELYFKTTKKHFDYMKDFKHQEVINVITD